MQNKRKLIYLASLSLFVSTTLFGCGLSHSPQESESQAVETESEVFLETETEVLEVETESTEVESILESTPLSYTEQVALDFVEKPEKRTREEAIEKMKELSRWYPAFYYIYENIDQYPIELILTSVGNPEMVSFLYGYLSSDGNILGGFTNQEKPEDYPLFLQFDPRWGYLPYGSRGTVGSSGCGPSCLAMAIFHLTGDRSCTPGAIAQYSLENGYYVEGVGTAWSLLANYPTQFGLTSYQINWSEANLKAELDKERVLICSVRPGNFTSAGHFIVIYGYDENGFKINDPKCVYRSQLSWTYEQIKNDIKATWTIGH